MLRTNKLTDHQSIDCYFDSAFNTKASLSESSPHIRLENIQILPWQEKVCGFLSWIDRTFPASEGVFKPWLVSCVLLFQFKMLHPLQSASLIHKDLCEDGWSDGHRPTFFETMALPLGARMWPQGSAGRCQMLSFIVKLGVELMSSHNTWDSKDTVKDLCELIIANGSRPEFTWIDEKLPDVVAFIVILMNGWFRFTTNADLGGVERVVVSALRPELGLVPRHKICLADLSTSDHQVEPGLLEPHGLFVVKGWTRMLACYSIMAAAFECADFLEAGPEKFVVQ